MGRLLDLVAKRQARHFTVTLFNLVVDPVNSEIKRQTFLAGSGSRPVINGFGSFKMEIFLAGFLSVSISFE